MKTTALDKLLTNVISDLESENITSKILELSKSLDKLNTLSKNDFVDIATELSSIKKLNKDILNHIVKQIEVQ